MNKLASTCLRSAHGSHISIGRRRREETLISPGQAGSVRGFLRPWCPTQEKCKRGSRWDEGHVSIQANSGILMLLRPGDPARGTPRELGNTPTAGFKRVGFSREELESPHVVSYELNDLAAKDETNALRLFPLSARRRSGERCASPFILKFCRITFLSLNSPYATHPHH
jgi:hypothetical protein